MGRRVPRIYPGSEGTWTVDKWYASTRLFRRGFADFEEAEKWLIRHLEQLRAAELHRKRPERLFGEAAAHYLSKHETEPSIVSETYHLESIMPTIGSLPINQVHDDVLAPHVKNRLAEGWAPQSARLEREGAQAVAPAGVQRRRPVRHQVGAWQARRVRVRLPAAKDGRQRGRAPAAPGRHMNNTAWQRARREAGLSDLHMYDLRPDRHAFEGGRRR